MRGKTLFPLPPVPSDVVQTPAEVAQDVVNYFAPSGRCLDPCRGNGVFWRNLPAGADWCEVQEGRDFYDWTERVDWIVSNPPYSIFADWLRHSFEVADNIVYLIPINKAFNSYRMMREISDFGGIPTIYVVGPGSQLKFGIGYAIGAIHFQRGYSGGTQVVFREAP